MHWMIVFSSIATCYFQVFIPAALQKYRPSLLGAVQIQGRKTPLSPELMIQPAQRKQPSLSRLGAQRAGRGAGVWGRCRASMSAPALSLPCAASPQGFPCLLQVSDMGPGKQHLREGARPLPGGQHPMCRYKHHWLFSPSYHWLANQEVRKKDQWCFVWEQSMLYGFFLLVFFLVCVNDLNRSVCNLDFYLSWFSRTLWSITGWRYEDVNFQGRKVWNIWKKQYLKQTCMAKVQLNPEFWSIPITQNSTTSPSL